MRAWSAFVAIGAAVVVPACLPPTATPCDDGLVCPVDKVCLPGGGGCASADNVAACDGLDDGDPCAGDFGPGGVCRLGACAAPRCGDRFVELDEACDDGNVVDGDGCSARCDSDETCGNGVIDSLFGEQCDAGPGLSRDGCASRCQVELPSWRELEPVTLARSGAAVAYDSGRGRIVLFGGAVAGVPTDELWEFDGRGWNRVEVEGARPEPRVFHAMAYDPSRRELVLAGGGDRLPGGPEAPILFDEIWTYAGQGWTRHVDDQGPVLGGRMKQALVYDPTRGAMLQIGGQYGDGTPADFTAYREENQWLALDPSPEAPPCETTSAAFHPGRDAVVLVCGHPSAPAETLQLGADGWGVASASPPGATATGGALVYDPSTDALALLGVSTNDAAGYNVLGWTLGSAGSWTLAPAYDAPLGRQVALAAHDPVEQRVIVPLLLGALAAAETWSLDDSGWEILADTRPLPGLDWAQLGWSPTRGRLTLVGISSGQTLVETWEGAGGVWARRFPASAPSDRRDFMMAVDPARDRALLFGGVAPGGEGLDDLWSWDGETWTQLDPGGAGAPPVRLDGGLAVDEARDQLVLFGGVGPGGGPEVPGETWAYDLPDGGWRMIASADEGPGLRRRGVLAYDVARGELVLAQNGDDWAWDGTAWRALGDGGGIGSTDVKAMTWNPTLGALIMVGNDEAAEGPLFAYVRRDNAWKVEFTEQVAPGTSRHAVAFDARAQRLVSLGADGRTWAFAYINGAFPPDACSGGDTDFDGLSGCDDPDCWGRCTPTCPPAAASCPADDAGCGDGACNPLLEDALLCPDDCAG